MFYKKQFKITQKEMKEYLDYYWMTDPEYKTAEDFKYKLAKLKKTVRWMKKISKKYDPAFIYSRSWEINFTTREITTKYK
jgi:hypothetical protein